MQCLTRQIGSKHTSVECPSPPLGQVSAHPQINTATQDAGARRAACPRHSVSAVVCSQQVCSVYSRSTPLASICRTHLSHRPLVSSLTHGDNLPLFPDLYMQPCDSVLFEQLSQCFFVLLFVFVL